MSSGGWSNQNTNSLTLPTGATSGARIVLDGKADVILVYNSAGTLIASIAASSGADSAGETYGQGFETWNNARTLTGRFVGATLQLSSDTLSAFPAELLAVVTSSSSSAELFSGTSSTGGASQASIVLASEGSATPAAITVGQQVSHGGTLFQGNLLQGDGSAGQPRITHCGMYTASVSGASGLLTFSHGAGFTPTFGLLTPLFDFAFGTWDQSFGTNGFSSTQARAVCYQPGGAFTPDTTSVQLYAMFAA